MSKHLIFDGQIMQTNAWHRGMGHYMLQLLHHIDQMETSTRLHIIFNDNIECDIDRFDVIKYLCPRVEQLHARLPVTADKSTSAIGYQQQLSQAINRLVPDGERNFVITSLFLFDFYAQYPDGCHKLAILYDLTPLLLWRDLGAYFPPQLYMSRFRQLYEADMVMTISETVRQDALANLGLNPARVHNINGGFTKPTAKAEQPKNVPEKYILFVSGDLPHKNNDVAARGFAKFVDQTKSESKLLVTSTFSDESCRRLQEICPAIIFSGNVSDEELEWLYKHADGVLFASKYEGLGIPILDAVYQKKPIIASGIPVFKEMSKQAFYFFDPKSDDQLAAALTEAAKSEGFDDKLKQYKPILEKYSWNNTAKDVLQAVNVTADPSTRGETKKKKLAIVAVNPGIADQIGRLAEWLYAALRERFEVSFFFDSCGKSVPEMERPTFLDYVGPQVADISELTLRNYRSHDAAVYLLDDLSLEYKVAQIAAVLPGVTIEAFGDAGGQSAIQTVVVDNQVQVLTLKADESPQNITERLQSAIDNYRPSESEVALRSGATNSAIIKRLLKKSEP